MPVIYELVDGAAFAPQASRILEEAWNPPAIRYTPEYLRWQLSFPGLTFVAAAAFDGNETVGFAGVSSRRLRSGATWWDVAVVSFVAVRPGWRNLGVAAGIYRCLLTALKELGVPVVTFAAAGSSAERLLCRAYAEAGFEVRPLGTYPVYTFLARGETPDSDWEAVVSTDSAALPGIVENCAADSGILWSDPTSAQIDHYRLDPRSRGLILITDRLGRLVGAAWAVRTEFHTTRGLDTVMALESVFLPRQFPLALPAVLRCAAASWNVPPRAVVAIPSLYGFEPDALRRCGIRQTGSPFQGYLCAPGGLRLELSAQGTNLEVI
jgi:GNAT superfamily N-acetyltransferase